MFALLCNLGCHCCSLFMQNWPVRGMLQLWACPTHDRSAYSHEAFCELVQTMLFCCEAYHWLCHWWTGYLLKLMLCFCATFILLKSCSTSSTESDHCCSGRFNQSRMEGCDRCDSACQRQNV